MATKQTSEERQTRLSWFVGGGLALLATTLGVLAWHRSSQHTNELANVEVGIPELYARPIVVDINGDGVEDVILVTGIDRGPKDREEDKDDWGREHGRFDAFVQAIDGSDGHVLYSIRQGDAYTSLGTEANTSERVILLADQARLGIARVSANGKTSLAIHDLRDGKAVKTLELAGSSSGRVCQNQGGSAASPKNTFWFEPAAGSLSLIHI